MPDADVTALLLEAGGGLPATTERLVALLYKELRDMASRLMRSEREDHTLQPTALVHEAYLRLVDQDRVEWRNRAHFLAIAAYTMRRVLVDHARRHRAGKRVPPALTVTVGDLAAPERALDLLALDAALDRLAERDQRQARVVELRYFGGLEIRETAEVLRISTATVKRDWRFAKAWLSRELAGEREA